VFLGEPPRTPYDLHFALFGIPVRVHPFFWVIGLILGMNSPNLQQMLVWIAALFVAILVHELGHAIAMRAYGYQPWVTLYGLGGLTAYNQGAYGSRRGGTWEQIAISAAGPGAGFIFAAVIALALMLARHRVEVQIGLPYGFSVWAVDLPSPLLSSLVNALLFISITWGIINLLPLYPLDGGQISRELFLLVNVREGIRISLMLSLATAAFLAVFGLLQWRSPFMAIMFGYFAYSSYAILQAYGNQRPW